LTRSILYLLLHIDIFRMFVSTTFSLTLFPTIKFVQFIFSTWYLCSSLKVMSILQFTTCTAVTFMLHCLQSPWMWHCYLSVSEIYYTCINSINCTGKNTSDYLSYALGQADANMYLCSEDLRPS